MRQVLGNWLQQFTCPDCGRIGAGTPGPNLPLCDVCDYKVEMRPSNNGKIYPNWEEVHAENLQTIANDKEQA